MITQLRAGGMAARRDSEYWGQRHVLSGAIHFALASVWRLAVAWWHDHPEPTWHSKAREEAEQLLSDPDMTSAFWRVPARRCTKLREPGHPPGWH